MVGCWVGAWVGGSVSEWVGSFACLFHSVLFYIQAESSR